MLQLPKNGRARQGIVYCANPVRGTEEHFASGRLAMIATPKQNNPVPAGATWCLDNGCGPGRDGSIGKGYPGDTAFLFHAWQLRANKASCLFVVAPDVLCDAAATLKRSAPMLPKIRALGFKAALVAQDGLEQLPVPWDTFDVLFLGGSTEWKLGPAARKLVIEAKRHGKWVHMGRVNSFKRLSYAVSIGCDSADGTYLVYGARRRPLENLNLPTLLSWLERTDQMGLAA